MAPTQPLILLLAISAIMFASFLASPFVAWRKGYVPYFWMFACGPLGLLVIAILPSTKNALTPEDLEAMQARANTTGAILTGFALFCGMFLVIPAVLFGV